MNNDSPNTNAKPKSPKWTEDLWKILLAGGVSAVCTALATLWINEKNPHLTVTTTNTVRFQGEGNKVGIANVIIKNDGNKEARVVECIIPNVTPTEIIISPAYLNHKVELSSKSGGEIAKVILPVLNPTESVTIAVLSTQGNIPDVLNSSHL